MKIELRLWLSYVSFLDGFGPCAFSSHLIASPPSKQISDTCLGFSFVFVLASVLANSRYFFVRVSIKLVSRGECRGNFLGGSPQSADNNLLNHQHLSYNPPIYEFS